MGSRLQILLRRGFATSSYTGTKVTREQVGEWNAIHNAFISLGREESFKVESDSIDQPLDGVAIAIKDNICTKDFPTTCASLILRDYRPVEDATVVKLLKGRGAVIMGKTNLDEFGMGSSNSLSYFGPAFNPHPSFPERQHVPGGSSGGSAAAVAAGMCYGALGTDTGGSIRLPASYCGVMGFKPSYGRISRAGLVAYASTLDTVGILAKDIRSISCIFDAIAGVDPKDPTSRNSARDLTFHPLDAKATPSLKEAVVGIPREYFLTELDKRTTQAWRDCIRQLKRDGATLKSVSLPNTRYALPAYYIIALSEASSNLARYDGIKFGHQANHAANFSTLLTQTREEGFGLEVKRRILLGTYALTSEAVDSYYLQALKVRRLVKQDFDAVFSNECVDFLLTPTTIGPSPDNVSSLNSIASYLNDVFTVPPSLAGIPAISFSWSASRDTPIGLQLVAPFDHDFELLAWAHALSQISPANR